MTLSNEENSKDEKMDCKALKIVVSSTTAETEASELDWRLEVMESLLRLQSRQSVEESGLDKETPVDSQMSTMTTKYDEKQEAEIDEQGGRQEPEEVEIKVVEEKLQEDHLGIHEEEKISEYSRVEPKEFQIRKEDSRTEDIPVILNRGNNLRPRAPVYRGRQSYNRNHRVMAPCWTPPGFWPMDHFQSTHNYYHPRHVPWNHAPPFFPQRPAWHPMASHPQHPVPSRPMIPYLHPHSWHPMASGVPSNHWQTLPQPWMLPSSYNQTLPWLQTPFSGPYPSRTSSRFPSSYPTFSSPNNFSPASSLTNQLNPTLPDFERNSSNNFSSVSSITNQQNLTLPDFGQNSSNDFSSISSLLTSQLNPTLPDFEGNSSNNFSSVSSITNQQNLTLPDFGQNSSNNFSSISSLSTSRLNPTLPDFEQNSSKNFSSVSSLTSQQNPTLPDFGQNRTLPDFGQNSSNNFSSISSLLSTQQNSTLPDFERNSSNNFSSISSLLNTQQNSTFPDFEQKTTNNFSSISSLSTSQQNPTLLDFEQNRSPVDSSSTPSTYLGYSSRSVSSVDQSSPTYSSISWDTKSSDSPPLSNSYWTPFVTPATSSNAANIDADSSSSYSSSFNPQISSDNEITPVIDSKSTISSHSVLEDPIFSSIWRPLDSNVMNVNKNSKIDSFSNNEATEHWETLNKFRDSINWPAN